MMRYNIGIFEGCYASSVCIESTAVYCCLIKISPLQYENPFYAPGAHSVIVDLQVLSRTDKYTLIKLYKIATHAAERTYMN